jgi:hypothetical protein
MTDAGLLLRPFSVVRWTSSDPFARKNLSDADSRSSIRGLDYRGAKALAAIGKVFEGHDEILSVLQS